MDFMRIIKDRRSIRKYEDKEIPDSLFNQVLEAVKWSPSWANTQCWELVAVLDQTVKEKLQATIAPKNPATKAITSAPAVLAMCAKLNSSGLYKDQVVTKFGDWFMFDLGLATQNLCLTAHHLGLATVIVGLFDHDKAKAVLEIPEGYELLVLIPIGYPAQDPKPPKRKEISEFTHYNKF